MAAVEDLKPGPELDALVAEAVMGWKDVRRESGGAGYRGKKPDKLGRFRNARVPPYSTEPREAAAIGARLEALGRCGKFSKELQKSTHAKGVPAEWAPPAELCRAALKAVGTARAGKEFLRSRLPARRAEALRRRKRAHAG
ncbi:MAG TPA: hypothetical protein VGH16_03585 [Candidatus Binatia bacterium]|jgi:hypothetical protein